jgi:ABC-type transporter Mla MlaB component
MRVSSSVFDCAGARLRAQSRRLATVVALSGEIRADNVGRVTQQARRFVLASTSVVLDLSGVTAVAPQAVALVNAIDRDCADAGVDWVLIPGNAVLAMLQTRADCYPVVASVPDALNYFADESLRRRNFLLPLLTKSA